MSALSASAFTAPVTRRALAPKSTAKRSARAFRCNAQYDSVSQRRQAESNRVFTRSQDIHNMDEFEACLSLAGDKLVMVAVESEEECVMSDDMWSKEAKGSTDAGPEACRTLSASLARIAREAENVVFANVQVLESGGGARAVAQQLGVTKFPTYQYYKDGKLLWQHVGAGAGANQALAEGVLYYGGAGAQGLNVADFVSEITSKADLEDFIQSCAMAQPAREGFSTGIDVPCDKQLAIVDVGVDKDAPAGCLHIFPAVISLARNTAGFTRWARLAIDKNDDTAAIAKQFGVSSVPSFVFIADGKVVDRYSGSDRVELMNHVLRFQEANGVKLPQRAAAKRMSTAEAKEIARAARERQKAEGRRQGW